MKKALYLVVVLVSLTLKSYAAVATNYLCESLDPSLQNPLKTIVVSFPSQIVSQEGVPSNPYSSVRNESDYFLLPTEIPAGGRMLEMTPFTTSNFRPWYGIEETEITLTDIATGEVFTAPITDFVSSTGIKVHLATLTVDYKDFYVFIYYALTTRYPSTVITWGMGASFGDVGSELDVLTCSQSEPEVIPANSIISVNSLKSTAKNDKYTLYDIVLERPLHFRHAVMFSADNISWAEVPRSDLLLNATLTEVMWKSEHKKGWFKITQ